MIQYQQDVVKIPASLADETGELLELTLDTKKVVFHQTQWCRIEDVMKEKKFTTTIAEHNIVISRSQTRES